MRSFAWYTVGTAASLGIKAGETGTIQTENNTKMSGIELTVTWSVTGKPDLTTFDGTAKALNAQGQVITVTNSELKISQAGTLYFNLPEGADLSQYNGNVYTVTVGSTDPVRVGQKGNAWTKAANASGSSAEVGTLYIHDGKMYIDNGFTKEVSSTNVYEFIYSVTGIDDADSTENGNQAQSDVSGTVSVTLTWANDPDDN